MGIGLASDIDAFVRWLCRGCKTNFKDEVGCVNGWFSNIPIWGTFENIIIAQCFVIVIIIIVVIII